MPEKNKPVWPPPEGRTCYLVYEESGGYQYVVRSNGKNIKFLIRTRDKDDLLETICQDARLHVYKATPRHLIELQGEAHWKYGNEKDGYNYPFADPPE